MTAREQRRERFLRDNVAIRLGGIAANLARVHSFSDHPEHGNAVRSIIEESKFFLEWAIPDADGEIQPALVELQLTLATWGRQWDGIWSDTEKRRACAEKAREHSAQVLGLSGLLRE